MKNHKKLFYSLLVVVIAILVLVGYFQKNNVSQKVTDTFASKCGFKVTSLMPNEKVDFPLTVTGTIDNSNAKSLGCSWQMFEGQVGVAQLFFDYNGKSWEKIGTGVPIKVQDWMATSTIFTLMLDFDHVNMEFVEGTKMKIIFYEENPSGQGVVDSLDVPIILGNVTSETKTYKNDKEGFSFSYPKEFSLAGSDVIASQPWENNTTDQGSLIVRVDIPRTTQPNTNFGEAFFSVGTSNNSQSVKNCLVSPSPNVGGVSSTTINGINFSVFKYSDAGAGNRYDVVSYHTVHDGKCVVLESLIHSSNIGNYSPDQGISEFDKSSIDKILETIAETFKFSN